MSLSAMPTSTVTQQAIPDVFSGPLAPLNAVTGVVNKVLGALLNPLATNAPLAPVDTPVMWGLLAWARRQSEQTAVGDTPTIAASPTATSLTTGTVSGSPAAAAASGNQMTLTVAAAKTSTNQPPVTGMPTAAASVNQSNSTLTAAKTALKAAVNTSPLQPVAGNPPYTEGLPNSTTGTVSGAVNATNRARVPQHYAVTSAPADGTVTINPNTGAFTYTPTEAARIAATETPGPVTDSFTVKVSTTRSHAITIPVSVPVSPDWAAVTPVAGNPSFTAGTPVAATGAVSGAVNATNKAGLQQNYTVVSAPANGTVTVNPTTGAFTYTPTQGARLVAGQTSSPVTDTFTVKVTTVGPVGSPSTTIPVTVPVSQAWEAVNPASVPLGGSPRDLAVSPDGSRLYVTSVAATRCR